MHFNVLKFPVLQTTVFLVNLGNSIASILNCLLKFYHDSPYYAIVVNVINLQTSTILFIGFKASHSLLLNTVNLVDLCY